jgi:transcriptional regulator with XRE-family HTH domain
LSSPEALIAARKKSRLTQLQLGKAVHERVSLRRDLTEICRQPSHWLQPSEKYLQKKISYWESGHARPNVDEMYGLAEVLKLEPRVVERWFLKSPSAAEELFRMLALSPVPSLVAVCYSAKPRAAVDNDVFNALLAGLRSEVSLAMFFPYPGDFGSLHVGETEKALSNLYKDVWQSTKKHYDTLYSKLPARKRDKQLGLFVPRVRSQLANWLVPPFAHRYTLIVQSSETSQFEHSLYTWVESEKIDGLYRVGTFSNVAVRPQVEAWQAYYGSPMRMWMKSKQLSDSAGFWKRVPHP